MPQVVIQQILSGPTKEAPFSSAGKMIEPVSWMVNGLVDGALLQNFKLRAFSQKVHWVVSPNGVALCDPPKTYKGMIEYKITTPSQANGYANTQHNNAPAQHHTQQPPTANQNRPAQQAPAVSARYNQEQLEDLMIRAVKFSKEVLGAANDQAIVSFAATYIIQATKEGIKIAVEKKGDLETEKIWELIYSKNLGDRVNNCNIPDDTMVTWWRQSGSNADAFAVRLNYEIQQLELGKDE